MVNAVILLALLDAPGFVYYLVHDGRLYYLDRDSIVRNRAFGVTSAPRDAKADALLRALPSRLSRTNFRISPYYGYSLPPNERLSAGDLRSQELARPECKYRVNVLCEKGGVFSVTNNYGFDSVLDYPYKKQGKDKYVIGIFGGSLALGFVKLTMPELFEDILAQVPALRGKTVTLLSFAREGFKQPQPLETLAYFLSIGQRFDLVVNIDGGNEILHALVNNRVGVDYSMPSDGQIGTS